MVFFEENLKKILHKCSIHLSYLYIDRLRTLVPNFGNFHSVPMIQQCNTLDHMQLTFRPKVFWNFQFFIQCPTHFRSHDPDLDIYSIFKNFQTFFLFTSSHSQKNFNKSTKQTLLEFISTLRTTTATDAHTFQINFQIHKYPYQS